MLDKLNKEPYENIFGALFHNIKLEPINQYMGYDNANNILFSGYKIVFLDNNSNPISESGSAIYLPPSDLPRDEFINQLLIDLGKIEVIEQLPDWVYEININGLDKVRTQLKDLEKKRENLNNLINSTEIEKSNLEKYYNLITSTGTVLETIVFDVFKQFGFDDLNNDRGKEYEDWRFEFQLNEDFQYGLIEVQGTDGNTSVSKINQCKKWVDDYAIEFQKDAKRIFVVNQLRLEKYLESLEKRNNFNPREIKFAKDRKICIIPTTTLFELINRKLAGENINRNIIETIILNTDGLIDISKMNKNI